MRSESKTQLKDYRGAISDLNQVIINLASNYTNTTNLTTLLNAKQNTITDYPITFFNVACNSWNPRFVLSE